MSKKRVTVTVDEAVLAEASAAVDSGRADSVSAWINQSMAQRVAHERRLDLLGELVADYEAEFGQITDDELSSQAQADRAAAAATRPARRRAG